MVHSTFVIALTFLESQVPGGLSSAVLPMGLLEARASEHARYTMGTFLGVGSVLEAIASNQDDAASDFSDSVASAATTPVRQAQRLVSEDVSLTPILGGMATARRLQPPMNSPM